MDGSLVEPDWRPLTLDELRLLLAQFPQLGEPTHILSLSPRPFSAASVVATRTEHGHGQRVFIKRHHRAVRDREGLLEEHRFLAHLRTHVALVPRAAIVLAPTDAYVAKFTNPTEASVLTSNAVGLKRFFLPWRYW